MATRKSTQRKLERQLNKLLLTVCIILLALLVQKLGLLGSGSAGAAGGSSAAQAAGSQPSTAGDGVTGSTNVLRIAPVEAERIPDMLRRRPIAENC